MHVLAPKPMHSRIPIFFNIDSSVGQNGNNSSPEDVMLVQFFIRVNAQRNTGNIDRNQLQRMLKVTVDGKCGPMTIDGIRAVQEVRKTRLAATVVDGRVSPSRGGYQYGAGVWTIVSLNSGFRSRYPEMWPRIQNHPNCPPLLKQAAERVL